MEPTKPGRKKRADAGSKRRQGQPAVHIQGWLSPENPREKSAIQTYNHFIRRGSTARSVICEAMIAYGEANRPNWQGAQSDRVLTDELYRAIIKMTELTERLSSIDFSQASQEAHRPVMEQLRQDVSQFALNTRNMISSVAFSDDDED